MILDLDEPGPQSRRRTSTDSDTRLGGARLQGGWNTDFSVRGTIEREDCGWPKLSVQRRPFGSERIQKLGFVSQVLVKDLIGNGPSGESIQVVGGAH